MDCFGIGPFEAMIKTVRAEFSDNRATLCVLLPKTNIIFEGWPGNIAYQVMHYNLNCSRVNTVIAKMGFCLV